MTPQSTNDDPKQLVRIGLIVVSLLLFGVSVFLLVIAWRKYAQREFVESGLNNLKPGDHFYLPILLLVPIVIQLIWMIVQCVRVRWGDDALLFYIFCLVIMSLSPFCYCLLWLAYVYDWPQQVATYSLASWLSLVPIGLLILSVIYITYLIMWSPEKDSLAIRQSDIRFPHFCRTLLSNCNKTRQHFENCLLERFGEKLKTSITAAAAQGDYSGLDKPAMVKELNRLLKEKGLYRNKDFDALVLDDASHTTRDFLDHKDVYVSEGDIQWFNRSLLEKAFAIRKTYRFEKVARAKRRWDGWQATLKAGVAKAPFWTISFFFAIFLGITYLLAFAFAFHDRAEMNSDNRAPALFMQRSPLFDVGEYPPRKAQTAQGQAERQSGQPSGEAAKAEEYGDTPWPEYVFYFESPHAKFEATDVFDKTKFEEKINSREGSAQATGAQPPAGAGAPWHGEPPKTKLSPAKLNELDQELGRQYKEWKKWVNYKRLYRLVQAIGLEDDAQHGQGLQIQLQGHADEQQYKPGEQQGQAYPSNYSLSEARAEAIKYELLERLAKNGKLGSNFQWVVIPLSNEESSIPPSPGEREEQNQQGNPDPDDRLNKLEARSKSITGADGDFVAAKIKSLREYKDKYGLPKDATSKLVNKLGAVVSLILSSDKPTEESKEAQKQKRSQAKDDLEEAIDAVRYGQIDKLASGRIAIVSIRPMRGSKSHLFAPLSLMDYMYFTIYTITTTGYGDIVPTTTYAKFLCSFANIIEVFFFVVFFNALLSLRGSKQEEPADERPESSVQDAELKGKDNEAGAGGELRDGHPGDGIDARLVKLEEEMSKQTGLLEKKADKSQVTAISTKVNEVMSLKLIKFFLRSK